MALYRKKAQVFVSEESNLNTYETQDAAEGFLAEIPENPLTIQSENYKPTTVRGDFLKQDEVRGLASAQISFRVPLVGSGVANTAPEWADALQACGFRESIPSAGAGIYMTYVPTSTFDNASAAGPPATRNPAASYSVTVLEDGTAYAIKGAFGNVVFTGNVGEPFFMEFVFTGAYVDNAADALETVTYSSVVPPAFQGASFAINFGTSATPIGVNTFTLDMGNNVAVQSDINDSNGVYGARIVDRAPTGSFDPEFSLGTADDKDRFYQIWEDNTTGSITTGDVGSGKLTKWKLDVARCVLRPPEQGDREGIRILNQPFAVSSAGGDVEVTNPEVTLSLGNDNT